MRKTNTYLCTHRTSFAGKALLKDFAANGCACRYAVYVLEASTSNRLTYFIPPLVSISVLSQWNFGTVLLQLRRDRWVTVTVTVTVGEATSPELNVLPTTVRTDLATPAQLPRIDNLISADTSPPVHFYYETAQV